MSPALIAPPKASASGTGILCLLGKAPWAVADQMLISATNFVTMVFWAGS